MIVNVMPTRNIVLGIPDQIFFSKNPLNEKPTVEKLIKPIPTSKDNTLTCITNCSLKSIPLP